MHWCVEGCSFQPFLKLCFLVKWLIFFPKVEFNICNDKYKNTYHPPIILRLIKVKTLKKFQHAFKKNICPLTLLCIYFSYIPSFNLEIAFFAPFILVFFRESKSFVFLSLKKKFFFFFKEAATWTLSKGCCLSMAYFICSHLCHLLWCRHFYGVNSLPLQIFWRLMEYCCLLECFRLQM